MMAFGLSNTIIEKFVSVFQRYPGITEVVIYGSRAKGNFREGSDIDISLKGQDITEDIRRQVWLDLDDLNTPFLIDLSVYNSIDSESLKEHIQRVGKIFYRKEE